MACLSIPGVAQLPFLFMTANKPGSYLTKTRRHNAVSRKSGGRQTYAVGDLSLNGTIRAQHHTKYLGARMRLERFRQNRVALQRLATQAYLRLERRTRACCSRTAHCPIANPTCLLRGSRRKQDCLQYYAASCSWRCWCDHRLRRTFCSTTLRSGLPVRCRLGGSSSEHA